MNGGTAAGDAECAGATAVAVLAVFTASVAAAVCLVAAAVSVTAAAFVPDRAVIFVTSPA